MKRRLLLILISLFLGSLSLRSQMVYFKAAQWAITSEDKEGKHVFKPFHNEFIVSADFVYEAEHATQKLLHRMPVLRTLVEETSTQTLFYFQTEEMNFELRKAKTLGEQDHLLFFGKHGELSHLKGTAQVIFNKD